MSPDVLVDAVFTGVIYGLIALSLTIVFQPTRVLNLAQGEALILGAAITYQVVALQGWGWAMALVLTAVAAVLMGLAMERMVMLPMRLAGSRHAWIIATLATAMIFQALFTLRYVDVASLRPPSLVSGYMHLLGAKVHWQHAITVSVALFATLAYHLFLERTAQGRAIRATAHNPDTAELMGVPVRRVITLSFVIGAVITSMAGFLAAPVLFVAPASGLLFTIKGFIAGVIGGMGSPGGAMVGGLIVGLLDTVVRSIVGGSAGNFAVFAALALILIAFPTGLFGRSMESHG